MPENLNAEHQLEYLKELRKQYEEALNNAQKTGDYSEAQKLKEELEKRLTVLETVVGINETEPQERKVEKGDISRDVMYGRAREIMGEDFFGYAEIIKAFGHKVPLPDWNAVPLMDYSERELTEAKKNGEMLILRLGTDKEGKPLTMEKINNIVQPTMSEDEGLLFRDINDAWLTRQSFFNTQTVREGWALVGKDVIPGSTFKDYIDQTRLLRNHLIHLGALIPSEITEASDYYLEEIREIMEYDVNLAIKKLSKLKINQNHRRIPVEILYDFVIRFKNTPNKERMLENVYDLTSIHPPGGDFISFGGWKTIGAVVCSYPPNTKSLLLGVVSVR